ncbi:MAG: 30S ribosome-binding factor RbfA [Gammaproteobacteria bacterium]|nr:30S ribosome-binding factor RbfA [Gammaproteobacteria bacterium]
MAREFHRSERVAEELQRLLSVAIREELDDPRLRLVTITDVEVSRDLGHAKAFFSSLDDGDPEAIGRSLGRAAGFLRGVVGRQLKIRSVPELHFVFDDSLQRGQHVRDLIDKAVAEDRSHQDDDERSD